MCGVFGFVAKGSKGPSLTTLRDVAAATMQRGPHAWGMAWIDGAGRLKAYKQTGPIVDGLGLLAMARDARVLIGHCRYATHGDYRNNLNNHPHPADGGWIVHNGMIHRYRRLINEFGLHPVTECDSEVLGLLIETLDGALEERCREATGLAADGPLVMLGLWKPGRLIAIRRGNPLHMGSNRSGHYLGSLRRSLPGRPQEIRDNTVLDFGA